MKNGQSKRSDKGSKKPFFKRHRGLLSFIISFVCCTAVLSVAAAAIIYYKLPSLRSSSGSSSPSCALSSGVTYPASSSFTMLVGVYSDSDGAPRQLMLYRLDTAKNRTVVMSLPLDLPVNFQNVFALSDVYKAGGAPAVSSALQKSLDIKIDFTCFIGSGNFVKIFDILGGLYGAVPETLDFTVPGSGRVIKLNASPKQYLDGTKIYALIAASYPSGTNARCNEQTALMSEFITEKLTGFYLNSPSSYYGDIFNCVSTNFSMNELLNHLDAIKAISSQGLIVSPPLSHSASAGAAAEPLINSAAVKGYFN